MSAQLTYSPRAGTISGVVDGRAVRLPTHRDHARISAWEKVQELRPGKVTLWDHTFERPHQHIVPGSAPTGPAGRRLKVVVENAKLEVFDYPGSYAQRFDGDDKVRSMQPGHRHRGSAVFVKEPSGGFYLHGSPPCDNPRCIVIVQDWDSLYRALRGTRQVSLIVEL